MKYLIRPGRETINRMHRDEEAMPADKVVDDPLQKESVASRPLPPVETRFKKGQSGNPKGRPRKPRVAGGPTSALDILDDRTFTVQIRDQAERLTTEEALQHKLYTQAIAGSQRARRQVLAMILEREVAILKQRPQPTTKVTLVAEADVPTNALNAMILLGIASPDSTADRHRSSTRDNSELSRPASAGGMSSDAAMRTSHAHLEWSGGHDPSHSMSRPDETVGGGRKTSDHAETDDNFPAVLLEPWAVQAALDRRSVGSLPPDTITLINRMTRDSHSLIWPPRVKRS